MPLFISFTTLIDHLWHTQAVPDLAQSRAFAHQPWFFY
jgi:hypothetical protein